MESMNMFYRVLKSEADKLVDFYEKIESEEGLNSYRIQVHSMKNSAATVGIVGLSGLAKVLEDAARNNEKTVIYAMTPIILEEWGKYKEKLAILFTKEALQVCDKDTLIALLENMRQAAEEMDITAMDEIMAELEQYDYETDIAEKMEQLAALVTQFDIEQTMELVEQMESVL